MTKRSRPLKLPDDFLGTVKAALQTPPERKGGTKMREMNVVAGQALDSGQIVGLQRGTGHFEAFKPHSNMAGIAGGLWKTRHAAKPGEVVRVRRLEKRA